MTWRTNLNQIINDTKLTDVYEFGVFSGESVCEIKRVYDHNRIPIRKFLCFDSFVGLPEETKEPAGQDRWYKGAFNACEKFGTNNIEDCIKKTNETIRQNANFSDTDLIFIPGFFEDVLTDDIVQKYEMKPAAYVDMDADIYSSTYTALDFMFRNNLIVKDTLVGYDDWGGSPGWQMCSDGESRAHKEICKKYDIKMECVAQFGFGYPHVHTVFIVKE